jgi:hypothetical protein
MTTAEDVARLPLMPPHWEILIWRNIHFGVKLEPTQRGFGNRAAAAQSAGNRAGQRESMNSKLIVSSGKAKLEF